MLMRMANFRGWEWIIILVLALLLFGGFKKLPDAARGVGRSLRIFKAETKGLTDDDKDDTKEVTSEAASSSATEQSAPTSESGEKAPVAAPTAAEDGTAAKN